MSTSIRDFIPISRLGQGSYSSVYRVKRISDQKQYALKKVQLAGLKQKERQNSVNEVRLLASLSPQYIIAYKESFFDQNSSILCVVMQFADGGDLLRQIKKYINRNESIPQHIIWKVFYDLTMGLKTLHSKNILHRDLKTANVFLVGDRYKLGDLNVSTVAKNMLARTQTGTPYYASPEVWRDEPYHNKSDIWSLGCLIYQMAALRPPFRAQDMNGLYYKVQRGQYQRISSKYSNQLSIMIGLCLKSIPKLRPSCQEILKHSCFQKAVLKFINIKVQNKIDINYELLSTIKYDKNLKINLPKAQYDSPSPICKQRPYTSVNTKSKQKINQQKTKVFKKQYQPPKMKMEQNNPRRKNKMQQFDKLMKKNYIQNKNYKYQEQIKKYKKIQQQKIPKKNYDIKKPGVIVKRPHSRVQSAKVISYKVQPTWWG